MNSLVKTLRQRRYFRTPIRITIRRIHKTSPRLQVPTIRRFMNPKILRRTTRSTTRPRILTRTKRLQASHTSSTRRSIRQRPYRKNTMRNISSLLISSQITFRPSTDQRAHFVIYSLLISTLRRTLAGQIQDSRRTVMLNIRQMTQRLVRRIHSILTSLFISNRRPRILVRPNNLQIMIPNTSITMTPGPLTIITRSRQRLTINLRTSRPMSRVRANTLGFSHPLSIHTLIRANLSLSRNRRLFSNLHHVSRNVSSQQITQNPMRHLFSHRRLQINNHLLRRALGANKRQIMQIIRRRINLPRHLRRIKHTNTLFILRRHAINLQRRDQIKRILAIRPSRHPRPARIR